MNFLQSALVVDDRAAYPAGEPPHGLPAAATVPDPAVVEALDREEEEEGEITDAPEGGAEPENDEAGKGVLDAKALVDAFAEHSAGLWSYAAGTAT